MSFSSFKRSLTPSRSRRRPRVEDLLSTGKNDEKSATSLESPQARPNPSGRVQLDEAAEPPSIADKRPEEAAMSPQAQLSPKAPVSPPSAPSRTVAFFEPEVASRSPSAGSRGIRSSSSNLSYQTDDTSASIHTLPALQAKGVYEYGEALEPVIEDDPKSYDLVSPPQTREQEQGKYSLETRSEQIFSIDHLRVIFRDPKLLQRFTTFLGQHRPQSVPLLIYYLDALKAIAAIKYANAVAEVLEPLEGHEFTKVAIPATGNDRLEERARKAFETLARDDLAAYVSHVWVNVVSTSIKQRITGTMPPHLREASEGLAEVFCLTDPSRPDNPIVFASEEFHRTTQYGVNYVIGRNCRFLQGPRTNKDSVRRLKEGVQSGRDVCETFVNYRRDGSPFMNLLMTAPLRDSRGTLRYYIGAQVDVSGLAKECTDLEGVQKLIAESRADSAVADERDEFQELSEMFNQAEMEMVRKHGGAMHRHQVEDDEEAANRWHRPRVLLQDSSSDDGQKENSQLAVRKIQGRVHGKLASLYSNYLLVRPYPSLRILFASPSLRVPGILQSPFMNRIGSSDRVRDELVSALAEGRGVTAKVRWVSKHEDEGRNRWIHCTPLYGSSGSIGVYMVVIIDEDASRPVRRFREAPPVAAIGKASAREHQRGSSRSESRQTTYEDSVRLEDTGANGEYERTSTMRNQVDYDIGSDTLSLRDYGRTTPGEQVGDFRASSITSSGGRPRNYQGVSSDYRPRPPLPNSGRDEVKARPITRGEANQRYNFIGGIDLEE